MRNVVVGTAGHIDHGKSSLVLALTGTDPDRLKEEKARGITIELGFAHAVIGETRVAFVDVPGHERFVRTMLAGVGGIDVVLLIVAADESVMPQTREHFDICRLLRIPRGIVVLTKCDVADGDTRALVREDVAELVKGSFLERSPVVEVSAVTGEGLDALRAAIIDQATHLTRRPIDAAPRLPIDRAFTMKGFGTVITGTLVAGRIAAEQELVVEPGGRRVKVRGVQVHGKSASEAAAGQRTAINLGGVEVGDVSRGETLMQRGTASVTRRVDAEIDLLPSAKLLKHGTRVRLHHGTAEVLGRVSIAGASVGDIRPGARALVRIRLEAPAVLNRGDRFILRAYSPPVTIGGGQVLDPAPTRAGIRTADGLLALEALRIHEDDLPAIIAMIDAAGLVGMEKGSLLSRAAVAPSRVGAVVQRLGSSGVAVAGDRLIASRHLEQAEKALLALVAASHKSDPMSDGLSRQEARERLLARSDAAVFDAVVDSLMRRKALVGTERLALPSHKAAVVGADERVRAGVIEAYRAGGLNPPDTAAVDAIVKAGAGVIDKVTALLLREKVLVRVDTIVFHAEALQGLKNDIAAMKGSTVDVATFKERYRLSRKFAIPLLEYLDRERITRRTGDARLVL